MDTIIYIPLIFQTRHRQWYIHSDGAPTATDNYIYCEHAQWISISMRKMSFTVCSFFRVTVIAAPAHWPISQRKTLNLNSTTNPTPSINYPHPLHPPANALYDRPMYQKPPPVLSATCTQQRQRLNWTWQSLNFVDLADVVTWVRARLGLGTGLGFAYADVFAFCLGQVK